MSVGTQYAAREEWKSLQQYVNLELQDVQAGFRKGRGTRDQIAKICWIIEKAREFQKNMYLYFFDYTKAFDCVDHNKLWKILKEMGILDHLMLLCMLCIECRLTILISLILFNSLIYFISCKFVMKFELSLDQEELNEIQKKETV